MFFSPAGQPISRHARAGGPPVDQLPLRGVIELSDTLAKAMAHGLPAVSFDCDTSPRGMIRHDVDGLPIPLGDVAGLISALDRLTGDAALRVPSAARAVEAREGFSMERIAGMWEEFFAEVR